MYTFSEFLNVKSHQVILEASEENLKQFVKLASSNFLIHKSKQDLWKLSDDGKTIIKLVDEEIIEENSLKTEEDCK